MAFAGVQVSVLLSYGLDGDGDLDLVADHPDALDELVVRDAEVVAVDGGRGEEGDPLVAPGVRPLAAILAGEDDGPRCAADREVAVDLDPVAVLHDSVAREGHRRID